MELKNCLITGLEIRNYQELGNIIKYSLFFYYKNQQFSYDINITKDIVHEKIFLENKYILAGAIFTNQFFDGGIPQIIDKIFIEKKLTQISYPKTPKEKLDNLFISLVEKQNFDGDKVHIINELNSSIEYKRLFFKSINEYNFYIRTISDKDLIKAQFSLNNLLNYSITFEGLNYYVSIKEKGILSNRCFIAMSFSIGMEEIRDAIKSAIIETSYEPILIDEKHIESSQTINDAIIAELKHSKFCIADFTEQKDGVYFESGFALGQGKQVIYCCRKDYLNKTHFDTNHFSHIIYETSEELKTKLKNKIEAWII